MNTATIKLMIIMKIQILIVCILKIGSVAAFSDVDIDQIILNSINEFKNVSDHTCILDKKVNKNGCIYNDPAIFVKYMKPKHYYFRWEEGRFKGQEVIYAAGRNNDKIVAHPGGIFRFVKLHLDPEGYSAMKRNHHSLRDSGMEKIMSIIEEDYYRSKETGLGVIQLIGDNYIDGKAAWVIYCEFPENRDFYAHRIFLYIDKELKLPVKITVFDWANLLFEEYCFRDLQINTGIAEKDFEPENPEYKFF
jgi:hypothetical protein